MTDTKQNMVAFAAAAVLALAIWYFAAPGSCEGVQPGPALGYSFKLFGC